MICLEMRDALETKHPLLIVVAFVGGVCIYNRLSR